MNMNKQVSDTASNNIGKNITQPTTNPSCTQENTEAKDELIKETSTNSMDVSSSVQLNMNIFDSPPRTQMNTIVNKRPKTPAQKQRQRKYNLRKYKNNIEQNRLDTTHLRAQKFKKLSSKPICATRTMMSTISPTTTQQQVHVPSKPENKQLHNTVRVVDFITDSNAKEHNGKVKGLLVTSEPSSTFAPNYTFNYVTVNTKLIDKYINYDSSPETFVKNHYLNIKDTVIFINEILFQFTEYTTGVKWYYCHYLDIDYHGNIILLQASDIPTEL